jgi:hypothetical protein
VVVHETELFCSQLYYAVRWSGVSVPKLRFAGS